MKKYLVLFLSALMPIVTNADDSYVDLGLPSGLLWATCNLGATSPEEVGYYYAWGETSSRSFFSSGNYYYNNNYITLYDISGTEYDAATFELGGTWRMPKKSELEELSQNCSRSETTINGMVCMILTGPNGNTLIIPRGGFGDEGKSDSQKGYGLWSSTRSGTSTAYRAWEWTYISISWMWQGIPIRPVKSKNTTEDDNPESAEEKCVDLGLPSGLLWATCNLGAESPEKYGTYYDWEKNPVIEQWDEVWRTPTKDDRDELVSHCTHTLTTINGIKGARYTGTNGNSIFLPFAGYLQRGVGPYKVGEGGQYWTTTQYSNNEHWVLAANRSVQEDNSAYYWPLTYFSFPVRPVTSAKPDAIKSISFDDGATERIYGIDGMPQRKLQKGLNIIRYRNGKTRKLMISYR